MTAETEATMHEPTAVPFRAEVRQLLNILAHSLYTDREIFLRELISNASDALHRVQFEMLTNQHVHDPDAPFEIRISVDKDAKNDHDQRYWHWHDPRGTDRKPGDDCALGYAHVDRKPRSRTTLEYYWSVRRRFLLRIRGCR